jgi:hypothetical protein
MTYPSPEPSAPDSGVMSSGPLTALVPLPAIVERLATGQILVTPARFILPHELREEHVRAEAQSRRQSAQWTAYHARRTA